MAWVLLVFIVIGTSVFAFAKVRRLPWGSDLHRLYPEAVHKTEWIAPEEIQQRVRADYLIIVHWQRRSIFDEWTQQWTAAPRLLAGTYLERYLKILSRYRSVSAPRYVGILTAEHNVEVRHFSDDGARCLLVDHQKRRRLETYDYLTHEFIQSQTIDDRAVVYQMIYDRLMQRWKIENFIQEMPLGWNSDGYSRKVRLLSTLPTVIGRDN